MYGALSWIGSRSAIDPVTTVGQRLRGQEVAPPNTAVIETEDHLDRSTVLHRQVASDLERPQHHTGPSGKSCSYFATCRFSR